MKSTLIDKRRMRNMSPRFELSVSNSDVPLMGPTIWVHMIEVKKEVLTIELVFSVHRAQGVTLMTRSAIYYLSILRKNSELNK